MINHIKQFFENRITINNLTDEAELDHRLKLACAALMLELIHVDETVTEDEEDRIIRLLKEKFDLNQQETHELIELAHEEKHNATDYYRFTSLINDNYTQKQKIKLVEQLWELAYADNEIDRFEEHLIRKLSELLHVPHAAFIKTKHNVIEDS